MLSLKAQTHPWSNLQQPDELTIAENIVKDVLQRHNVQDVNIVRSGDYVTMELRGPISSYMDPLIEITLKLFGRGWANNYGEAGDNRISGVVLDIQDDSFSIWHEELEIIVDAV